MTLSEKRRRELLRRKYMLILDLNKVSLRPLVSQKVPPYKFKQDVKNRLLPKLCFFKYSSKVGKKRM